MQFSYLCMTNQETMPKKQSIPGHLAGLIAYSIFGFNIIVCKDLTGGGFIPPLGIFTLRSLGAGSLFWLVSLFMPKEKVDKSDYMKIFLAPCLDSSPVRSHFW